MSADGDESLGAPAASIYEGHSGGIVDTLNDLLEKASSQLDDARKTDTADLHNFQMQKQSLVDEIKYAKKELGEAKKGILMSAQSQQHCSTLPCAIFCHMKVVLI